jgi:ribose/xylose/arabinose/galactoside ABC-type transport system permease subunit
MKTNTVVFWVMAAYFFVLTAVYTVWAIIDTGVVEWIGTIAIGLSGILATFIAFYLQVQLANQGGVLPEDSVDADIDDGDPELGFYSPWSWWPVMLAAGAAIAMVGFAVGIWVAFYAIPVVLIALVGWSYEYYRGYFAR